MLLLVSGWRGTPPALGMEQRLEDLRLVEGMLGKRSSGDRLSLGGNQSVKKMLAKQAGSGGAEAVLFSEFVVKVNPRGRLQERILLMTDHALYNLLPSNYGKCKRRIALRDIESVTQSRSTPEFVLHVPSEYDYRLVSDKRENIVGRLRSAYLALCGQALEVQETDAESLKPVCVTRRMGAAQRAKIEAERSNLSARAGAAGAATSASTRGWGGEESKVGLADFDFLKVLGRGSFGKVMLCCMQGDPEGRTYAMKILRKAAIVERDQVEHTKSEREILQHVDHPFLMKLHYAFQSDSKLYLVMDYLTGGELFFHLKNERRFSEDRGRFYAAEILLGIEHLHAHGVIYRDLKPENVLLDGEGHVCLTDFGLSKRAGPDQETQTFCGTPEYLAPEVIVGDAYGKAVDWWSFGVMLYEMLVGLPPFYSENVHRMYELIQRANLRFPDGVSPEARSLLVRLLQRNPALRLGSGADDAAPIRAHPFFAGVDWDALYAKRVEPPFRPKVHGDTDTSNFDAEFTSEPAIDSHVPSANLASKGAAFDNFTFVPGDSAVAGAAKP